MATREKAKKPQLLQSGGGEAREGEGPRELGAREGRGGEERPGKGRDQRSWEEQETERDEMTVSLINMCSPLLPSISFVWAQSPVRFSYSLTMDQVGSETSCCSNRCIKSFIFNLQLQNLPTGWN